MSSINLDPIKQRYYPENNNNNFKLPCLDNPFLTEIAIKNMFSVDTNNSPQSDLNEEKSTPPLKRSFSQKSSGQASKRKKTTSEIEETVHQEKDNIATTTIPAPLLLHTTQTTSESANNAAIRMTDEIKSTQIKNNYVAPPSHPGYYQEVFEKESKKLSEAALQMDRLEAQAVLGSTQKKTWWIRKSFHNGQETYKGIVYENGVCSHLVLPTSNDLIYFFNQNSSVPHLEALRREKIEKANKIRSEYIIQPASEEYYQTVLHEEYNGISQKTLQLDCLEAQIVLDQPHEKTWWIRKGFHNGQETHKGVVYLDGTCFYSLLRTDHDLISFYNQNSSAPHLEALRQEKIEKANKIRSEYMIQPASEEYYQTVLHEEYNGISQKTLQLDCLEAQIVLDQPHEKTWWIRKGFHNGQETHKGVVYLDGTCFYSLLRTDHDLISFYNQNSSTPHLKALRREKIEKIDKIRNEYMIQPSSEGYYQTVLHEEYNRMSQKTLQLDCLEAQIVLDQPQGTTWWIRKSFHNGQETHKGVVYLDGTCSYSLLPTNHDLISFCNKNSSIPNLETLRKEKLEALQKEKLETLRKKNVEKINMIRSNHMFFTSSSIYCQTVFNEECKGSFEMACEMDALETKVILGKMRKTWWIREGFSNNQKICKGIIYANGACSYHPLLTDDDWIAFFDKNSSILDLKTFQKRRVEKINTIRSNHMFFYSSSTYCQTVFNEECKGSFETAHQMDALEAQTVLSRSNAKTWWIREGFSNNQKICKGIIYANGTCSYHPLLTDNDWIIFFNKMSSIPDLKILQKNNIEMINMIQSNYTFFCSSSTYCQTVFNEECKGSLKKARQMDILEAQAILGTTQGKTWWIREGFSNNQKIYKGIIYANGACSHHGLLTNHDRITFFKKHSSTPDLKTFQKEKVEEIKTI